MIVGAFRAEPAGAELRAFLRPEPADGLPGDLVAETAAEQEVAQPLLKVGSIAIVGYWEQGGGRISLGSDAVPLPGGMHALPMPTGTRWSRCCSGRSAQAG